MGTLLGRSRFTRLSAVGATIASLTLALTPGCDDAFVASTGTSTGGMGGGTNTGASSSTGGNAGGASNGGSGGVCSPVSWDGADCESGAERCHQACADTSRTGSCVRTTNSRVCVDTPLQCSATELLAGSVAANAEILDLANRQEDVFALVRTENDELRVVHFSEGCAAPVVSDPIATAGPPAMFKAKLAVTSTSVYVVRTEANECQLSVWSASADVDSSPQAVTGNAPCDGGQPLLLAVKQLMPTIAVVFIASAQGGTSDNRFLHRFFDIGGTTNQSAGWILFGSDIDSIEFADDDQGMWVVGRSNAPCGNTTIGPRAADGSGSINDFIQPLTGNDPACVWGAVASVFYQPSANNQDDIAAYVIPTADIVSDTDQVVGAIDSDAGVAHIFAGSSAEGRVFSFDIDLSAPSPATFQSDRTLTVSPGQNGVLRVSNIERLRGLTVLAGQFDGTLEIGLTTGGPTTNVGTSVGSTRASFVAGYGFGAVGDPAIDFATLLLPRTGGSQHSLLFRGTPVGDAASRALLLTLGGDAGSGIFSDIGPVSAGPYIARHHIDLP